MEGEDEEQTSSATIPTSMTTTVTSFSATNTRADARTLVIASNVMPDLVRRRHIMLQWLELCHNQSIAGFFVGNAGRAGDGIEKKVMWNDTIEALQRKHQRGGIDHYHNDTKDKITEFHPDAPRLLLQQLLL